MKRRAFLGAVASGAALLTWPAWLRRGFAGESCDDKIAPLVEVTTAFRRANDAGKPLLVLVIPADDGEKWSRGQAFGELLNHGSQAQLAPLALVEVVCATMDSVRRVVPSVGGGEPLMLLIDADSVPAAVRRLDARLPTLDPYLSWDDREKRQEQLADQRIAALAKVIGAGLAPDVATLAKRAALARLKLAVADVARLERTAAGTDSAPVALVDAGAAVVAHAGARSGSPALSDKASALLAAAVRARLTKKPPRGSHWATSSGCGTDIEGVAPSERLIIACGMGHVPEKSRRFLYFFRVGKTSLK